MEYTGFESIILPVSLATIEVLAGCWVVSAMANGVRRLVNALLGRTDEARGSRDVVQTGWDSSWIRRDAVGGS
jgi:hypothetical protein